MCRYVIYELVCGAELALSDFYPPPALSPCKLRSTLEAVSCFVIIYLQIFWKNSASREAEKQRIREADLDLAR